MKKTILIIQDSARLNISDWLQLKDFHILAARDGISGLVMVKKFQVDLIFSEIPLPKINGFELLKTLRKNPNTAKIPFIFLTAKTDKYSQWKAQQLGANGYLTKPLRFSQFLQVINNQLEMTQIQQNQTQQFLIKEQDLIA